MLKFFNLKVIEIVKETENAVSFYFETPENRRDVFRFDAGQYLTIEAEISGVKQRRAYSICTSPNHDKIGFTVKRVVNGIVSNYLNDEVKVGSELSIMPPQGKFILKNKDNNLYLFGAGSGITPLFSMIKDRLENSKCEIHLFYGNKRLEDTIYYQELLKLGTDYSDRLKIYFFFSQDNIKKAIKGRVEQTNLVPFESVLFKNREQSQYLICGPEVMINHLEHYFIEHKVPRENIRYEKFYSTQDMDSKLNVNSHNLEVQITLDGEQHHFPNTGNSTIIEMMRKQNIEAPYSCNIGNCSTCIAKILEGEVYMKKCESLDEDEIEDGYILACQAIPITENLSISFDE